MKNVYYFWAVNSSGKTLVVDNNNWLTSKNKRARELSSNTSFESSSLISEPQLSDISVWWVVGFLMF